VKDRNCEGKIAILNPISTFTKVYLNLFWQGLSLTLNRKQLLSELLDAEFWRQS
jgi:hypothetical protein